MKELERRGKNIRVVVRAEVHARKAAKAIVERCSQAPVLGFTCGRYYLNLVKEHIAELIAGTTGEVQVGNKANTTTFI